MITSIDVLHNIGKLKKSFIATLDNNFTQFFSKINMQLKARGELMLNFANLGRDAIIK